MLKSHRLLIEGLVKDAGKFRSKDVAVYRGDKIVHVGARAEFVPKFVKELFNWAKQS
ncbi:hypothetical protein [Actinobacillus vicugnae]|uniref:hypothetical protein n=1 Tax=Actinobacillus vicugnae TaxID=2573093 RepID=UPI00313CE334